MRGRLIILAVLICLVVGGWFGWRYYKSFVTINVVLDGQGNSLEVSLRPYDHELQDQADSKDTTTFNSNGSHRLRKGSYELSSPATEVFSATSVVIDIQTEGQTLTVKPDYSQTKMAELLKQEESAITKVLSAKYPSLASKFTISGGKLYERGEWYGAQLISTSNDEENNDTLKVVLRKQEATWQLVTTPPDIFISLVTYPDIPRHILIDLNR